MTATLSRQRPQPGPPRPYSFPDFEVRSLSSGFRLVSCHVAGRPIGAARLIFEAGAENEPEGAEGAASLAAKGLVEGTKNYDALAFVEAAERLGADILSTADFDALEVAVSVPIVRMEPALELLAEAVRRPVFPETEIERLRQERLNQIMQQFARPELRAQLGLLERIYTKDSPYSRPPGGSFETVSRLSTQVVEEFYRTFATPGSATLIVCGDLEGIPVDKIAEGLFGDWSLTEPKRDAPPNMEAPGEPQVTIVNRPGSVQSAIVAGHVGLPRLHPDYFPAAAMLAAVGGLFNSRLNMKLREEKGYTYGARAMNHYRRQAGPFFARSSVATAVTKEALSDTFEVIRSTHDEGITESELADAKDYLLGVFPLRFETPENIAEALSLWVTYGLPDNYFETYRSNMEAVSLNKANEAAAIHLKIDRMQIVIVGDAGVIHEPLQQSGLGTVEVVEDAPLGKGPA